MGHEFGEAFHQPIRAEACAGGVATPSATSAVFNKSAQQRRQTRRRNAPEIGGADVAAIPNEIRSDEFEFAAFDCLVGTKARPAFAMENMKHPPAGIDFGINLVVRAFEFADQRAV